MTHRAQPHSATIVTAPIPQLPQSGGHEPHAIVGHRKIAGSLFHIIRDTTKAAA
jgi:hypothetical protein